MITLNYYFNKIKENKIKTFIILIVVILIICSPLIISIISNTGSDTSKTQIINTRPKNVSNQTYEYAVSAIEVADDYISAKIDGDTTKEKLLNIEIFIKEKEGYDGDSSVVDRFTLLKYSIESHIRGGGTYQDINENRNALADMIHYPKK